MKNAHRIRGFYLLTVFLLLLFSRTVLADDSGTSGTCSWSISNGTLSIYPTTGSSCELDSYGDDEWTYRDDVTGIAINGNVKVNEFSRYMFNGMENLTDISGLAYLDVSNVTYMNGMFYGCSALTDLTPLKSWDVSYVADMSNMFESCSSLTDLTPLKSWDVSNVTKMSYMFCECSALTDLTPLKSWDVSNVTNMSYMFRGCSALTDLTGQASWDVSNVADMSHMFESCSSLTDLTPLKSWDVSNVKYMPYMFCWCSALTDLTLLTSWDVSYVGDMSNMFENCSSLTDLTPLKSWDVSNVVFMEDMFLGTGVSCSDIAAWKLSDSMLAETKCIASNPGISGLNVTVGGNIAKLSWSTLSGAKSYEIYRSTAASSGFAKIGTSTTPAYNSTGLSWNTTYYFKVRAQLSNGTYSAYSDAVKAVTPSAKVTGLKATVSGTTAKLSWTKLAGAKSYVIYRSTNAASGYAKIGTSTGNAYNAAGLNYGTTYYFKVRSLLTDGTYSGYSTAVTAKTSNGQVSGLKAALSGTTAKLSWSKLAGAKSYEVYQCSSSSASSCKTAKKTGLTAAAFNVTGLNYGTTYYFRVRAKMSNNGYSNYSSIVTAKTSNGQVSGLKAVPSGNTLKLSWSKLAGAKSYEVYQCTSTAASSCKTAKKTGLTTAAFNVTGLNYGTTYYFRVRAKMSNNGYSNYSSIVTAKTSNGQVTGLKTTLSATLSGVTTVLNWSKLPGAKSYEIYRSTSAKSGFTKIGTTGNLYYKLTGLRKETAYYFKVRALMTNGGYSEFSDVFKVVEKVVPAKSVTGLKASRSGTAVTLNWNALSGAQSYEIYQSTSEIWDFTKIGSISGTSYNVSKLSTGKTYYFKVRALMKNGAYSEYSDVVICRPPVTGLKATRSRDGESAKLSWTALSGAKSYEIYQSESQTSGFTKIGETRGKSYNVSRLSAGKTYYFKVRAQLSSIDYSEFSDVVAVRTRVTGLKAARSSDGASAKLSWTALSGAKSYEIYQSESQTSGFTKIGRTSGKSYNASRLRAGKTYYYKVRAQLNSIDYSEFSDVVAAMPVTGLKAVLKGTSVKLSWNKLSGVKSYAVYRSTSSNSGYAKIGTGTSASYSVSGLKYDTTYYFKIQAVMSNGTSGYSDPVSVKPVKVSGLKATLDGTTAKLSWSKLSGVKSYAVYRSTSSNSGYAKIGTSTSASYNASGLKYDTTYYFKILAVMSNGTSGYSDPVSVKPVKVSGLKATIDGTTAKLSWNKLSGAKSYAVYRSTSSNSGYAKIGTSTSASYNASGLSYDTTYYFKILAVMSNGTSGYSDPVSVKLVRVSGLKVSVSGNTAKLTWTALSGSKSYEIWRSTSASSGFTKIGTTASTAYNAAGLSYGTTYYFKIRALMTTGKYSNYSAVVQAVTPEGGTLGTCAWNISDGTLTIEPQSGSSCTLDSTNWDIVPAWANRGDVTRVVLNGTVKAGSSTSSMFDAMYNLSDISGLSELDVSNVTDMGSMFAGCSSLTNVSGLQNWDVSNVTETFAMFSECSSLTNLSGLQNWDVSNVTGMNDMFPGCSSLTDVSALQNWDVSNVINMECMFGACGSLTNLSGLQNWDVSNVTYMYNMFQNCSSLTDLSGLQNWDVSNVINMNYMFYGCSSLTNLSGLQNWYVSNVTQMFDMFGVCGSLTDVSALQNWDVSNVINMECMFNGCLSLTDVSALQNWVVSSVLDMYCMFVCTGVSCSDLPVWVDTEEVKRVCVETNNTTGPQASASGLTAKLTWERIAGAESYEVYRSASVDSEFLKIGTTKGTSYEDAEPDNGETRYYKVRALLENGEYSEFIPAVREGTSPEVPAVSLAAEITEECSEDGSSCTLSEKICTETECTITSKVCVVVGDQKACADPVVTVIPVLTETPVVTGTTTAEVPLTPEAGVTETPAAEAEITEECSEDGSTCTYSEKVCTETECTVTSKVCVVVGDQKACADPVVTVMPVLTETPAAGETPDVTEEPAAEPTATAAPEAVVPTEEVSEECSEDGSTCTVYSKVCTGSECTITSKVCVVVGDQKACADPIVTVVPVLTETPAATEEATVEPEVTEEVTTEPAATEEVTMEPTATEEATAEPAATEEMTAEPAATEEAAAEPAATEEVTAEPAATEEATEEPEVTEESTAEPAATAEPEVTEEATAEPEVTEEATAEPAVTEEATAEPAVTEEATAEPAVTEEATAEPEVTEEVTVEPAVTEEATVEPEVTEEPTATEDLTIREIYIEDLTEDTLSFKSLESYIIKPEKLKIVPEAADWADLTFKLDDETVAAFKATDIELIKAEGLTINGLVPGSTILRIQAGDVEKTVTLVITLPEADIQATLEAEAAALAAAETASEPTPEAASE